MTTANVTTPQPTALRPTSTPQAALEQLGVQPSPLALLLLGRGTDPTASAASTAPATCRRRPTPTWSSAPARPRRRSATGVFVLGHHYQRDEVIQFADVTGDCFKLAQQAAARPEAEFIVFCGVHFMAESADILTGPDQQVLLPDLAAGCSMADMATVDQVEECWDELADAGRRRRAPSRSAT